MIFFLSFMIASNNQEGAILSNTSKKYSAVAREYHSKITHSDKYLASVIEREDNCDVPIIRDKITKDTL